MFRPSALLSHLGIGLLAALALGACSREQASDSALEPERSARAEADATERHPVAASQAEGAGRYEQDGGDASSQIAGRDPLDVLDPRQPDAAAPAGDATIAAQAGKLARSEAIARCATLAPRDRSDCESYAMSELEDEPEDADIDSGSDAAKPADDDDL